MPVAFVLISTNPGKEDSVFKDLKALENVEEIYTLFGEYDIIAKVRGDDINEIGQMIIDAVRVIDGVNETKTLMGIKMGAEV